MLPTVMFISKRLYVWVFILFSFFLLYWTAVLRVHSKQNALFYSDLTLRMVRDKSSLADLPTLFDLKDTYGPDKYETWIFPDNITEDKYFTVNSPQMPQGKLHTGKEKSPLRQHWLDYPFLQRAPDHNYINLMKVSPPPYLPQYRNPCWEEYLPSSNPYLESYFYNDTRRYPRWHKTFLRMSASWQRKLGSGDRKYLRCLPFYYIAGFAKCGTSDLYEKLALHPHVVTLDNKEIHWWSKGRIGSFRDFGFVPIKNYVDLFDEAADKIRMNTIPSGGGQAFHPVVVGDGSPSTIDFNDFWRNIPENEGWDAPTFHTGHYICHISPRSHVIIMLRNPADRLYSDYTYFQSDSSKEQFDELVRAALPLMTSCLQIRSAWSCVTNITLGNSIKGFSLSHSMYYPFIQKWLEVYPRENLHLLRLEDYKMDVVGEVNALLESMGMDRLPTEARDKIAGMSIANARKPEAMLAQTKELLDQFFRPLNEDLAALLEDDRFLWGIRLEPEITFMG